MEKLKVGDEVYVAYSKRYKAEITGYKFQKVVRLTNTRAVLESGIQIVNRPLKGYENKIYFLEYGNRVSWYLSNDDAKKESEKFHKNIKISNWFFAKKFTDEEKELIYNQFKDNE